MVLLPACSTRESALSKMPSTKTLTAAETLIHHPPGQAFTRSSSHIVTDIRQHRSASRPKGNNTGKYFESISCESIALIGSCSSEGTRAEDRGSGTLATVHRSTSGQ